ncbi:hypothetical protein ScPMuIL_011527 [Solemya velum]
MAEKDVRRHIIFTAETHNFPTGVAPFPGATTGTGGRIRDVQSAGRGAHVVAGTAGYCFGNLQIPDYKLPWEDDTFKYPSNFASPLDIAIEASNGASDYGNKFGEPVLAGFARSFGLSLPGGERREYIKPIMFSGGIGQLEDCHIEKGIPEEGMLVAKIGGPVYRIGVGGGAASSVQVQGDNKSELDFGAVQRGDAEMEQKLNRLIRGCIEMSDKNPIVSIHDQGAGGNGRFCNCYRRTNHQRLIDQHVVLGCRSDVKCSSNWMWPAKLPGEGAALYDACKAMCDVMEKLGIAVDGGKDSLSMAARVDDVTVKAPGTLVVSAYVGCPDISLTVTPDLKCPNSKGVLLHIDLSRGKHRLGGSALAQCQEQIGDESPGLEDPQLFSRAFNVTQSLITERLLSAGHDISDGGLITCVMEMAFAGNCGIEVDIITKEPDIPAVDVYFAEELGLLLEVAEINLHKVLQAYSDQNVPCVQIGYSQRLTVNEVQLMLNGHEILVENMTVLRDIWEETSFQLEKRQASPCCVEQESTGLKYRISPPYHLSFDPEIICFMPKGNVNDRPRAKVAVLREEGSNSDREMAAVLHMAGFTVWDINMQDLCSGEITLDEFEGLVFVGGFSYADVCGSAKGWAATAVFNKKVHDQLTKFRERTDTFSLGVCNGCQLMALLGWVAPDSAVSESGDQDFQQGVLLDHNASERFECRFSTVKVYNSPSIMLTGLEGTTFGMWSAHGEGRMVFKSPLIKSEVLQENLAPVRYVDDENQPTVVYPFNPNGSPDGIAALCSVDGRHLAIMPHPERCFLPWQCPWIPESLQGKLDVTPWFKMFQNAFDWCMKHKQS